MRKTEPKDKRFAPKVIKFSQIKLKNSEGKKPPIKINKNQITSKTETVINFHSAVSPKQKSQRELSDVRIDIQRLSDQTNNAPESPAKEIPANARYPQKNPDEEWGDYKYARAPKGRASDLSNSSIKSNDDSLAVIRKIKK